MKDFISLARLLDVAVYFRWKTVDLAGKHGCDSRHFHAWSDKALRLEPARIITCKRCHLPKIAKVI